MIDTRKMLDLLDEFHAAMRDLIASNATVSLPEKDLETVLDLCAERGLWAEKNEATLNAIAAGGKSRSEAFVGLTTGNVAIQRLLMEFHDGKISAKPKPRAKAWSKDKPAE